MVQTAEGALNEVHSMLQRVRELAVQYKNGTLSTNDRTAIQSEVDQLKAEINRIGTDTEFNGIELLNSARPRRSRSRSVRPTAADHGGDDLGRRQVASGVRSVVG